MFENIVLIVTAVWLLFVVALMTTQNLTSFVIFRFIPLILAVLIGILALKGFGIL